MTSLISTSTKRTFNIHLSKGISILTCNRLFTTKNSLSLLPEKSQSQQQQQQQEKTLSEKDIVEGKESTFPGIAKVAELVLVKGKGSFVTDINGENYLDFTSGIGVLNTGHCHPKISKAVIEQATQLVHAQVVLGYHDKMLKLISKLKTILPSSLDSFFFWNSGSEAIEASIKIARQTTKKKNLICFQGGYHGRTYGGMSLTNSKTITGLGYGPFLNGVHVAPYPYASQLPKGLTTTEMSDYCIEELERILLQRTAPSDTAAVIVETILGEGGYIVPPKDFLLRVQDICKKNDILFILDEVQCGFGRTGKMFAFEHFGVVPDIVAMAKGIASGYPISAIATRKEISKKQPAGSMGGTYSGNVISCTAALATLEVFEEEKLLENTIARGKELEDGLRILMKKGYPIKDVRGLGLMQAIEFEKDVPKGIATAVTKELVKEHMLLLTCGIFEVLRFIPPLTISKEEVQLGLDRLEIVLARLFGKK